MSHLYLIWRGLMRKKARTLFTLLSVLVAFVLFAFLAAINIAFTLGIDVTGENRLLIIHKTSLILPLPKSMCPMISCSFFKLRPCSSMCEAKECRRIWGETVFLIPAISAARLTIFAKLVGAY